ncbi:thiamine diphosphokinase [Tropicibacter naphthalenivorans]|uniref:Thiamine diphosphokinase n=1 Tax=Tropicibacter naphthalenivorans TaxID=441103 RepID=A0A0P1GK21_9RHOB|nr:thiamine diphosphokinase [Tropicibacter naphthalenivorans]CUH76415.1 thiamine pyrophosphokinase [Tropicibacter naphthalenivorans]SMC66245.1 thiamine pyrophosphokinase [Tropicibacter naphthalenivorans]
MKSKIVHTSKPVVLVGGGQCDPAVLIDALNATEVVVAADGGAQRCIDAGRMPDVIIGDMDSLSAEVRLGLPAGIVHQIDEQDSTDFDKCLRNIQSPLVLGYGFLGARLDHQLAALTVLVRRADRLCLLIGDEDVACVVPPSLTLALPVGMRLSLFPMGPVRGRSQGLKWPIDHIDFAPNARIGTSNEVSGPVRLAMDRPQMLVILPIEALPALLSGLAASPSRWPEATD